MAQGSGTHGHIGRSMDRQTGVAKEFAAAEWRSMPKIQAGGMQEGCGLVSNSRRKE